jgi:hypothetical protein
MNGDLLERASWTWGLSLIALTVAIHALWVVMMARDAGSKRDGRAAGP